MTENERTIRDFIAAWSRLDVDELIRFFSVDGVYHNMPLRPVSGHAALRDFIGAFIKDWSATEWDVLTLVCQGDLVVAERLDRSVVNGKAVSLPCCGVFEMADGRIKVWRDYFDMGTYVAAVRA